MSNGRSATEKAARPFSYSSLAQETGLTSQHISRVLRGITRPSTDTARKLAAAMGVTVDTLLIKIEQGKP